jgi:hypothetical protein
MSIAQHVTCVAGAVDKCSYCTYQALVVTPGSNAYSTFAARQPSLAGASTCHNQCPAPLTVRMVADLSIAGCC